MQNKIFELNPRLENDSLLIKKLTLCELRLMKDGELDWFLLVPRREGAQEITDLSEDEAALLWSEIKKVSNTLKAYGKVDKINIGMIGNIVTQLHVHIIGRLKTDRAWPHTIWGSKAECDFNQERLLFWKDHFKA